MLKYIKNWRISRKTKNSSLEHPIPPKEKTRRIGNPLEFGLFVARKLWFWAIFIPLFRFVREHWDKCVDFSELTGYNLLFITFLIMIFLPLLTGFKLSVLGSGMEAKVKPDSSTAIFERIKAEAKKEDALTEPVEELSKKLVEMMHSSQDERDVNEQSGGESK